MPIPTAIAAEPGWAVMTVTTRIVIIATVRSARGTRRDPRAKTNKSYLLSEIPSGRPGAD